MSHARIMPSAADRWVECPGSIIMEEQFPELNESDGKEGTASHWAASEMLLGNAVPEVGDRAPNGVVLTDEIIQGAEVFCTAVPIDGGYQVEVPLAVPGVHSDCWGTPDLWYYLIESHTLHIWDYKYGWGIVDAHENWQLLCYASGALHSLSKTFNTPVGLFDQNLKVVLHIVQPRPYHIEGPHREWTLDAGELRGYVNRLNAAAHSAMGENPKCNSGPHCQYCGARHACPAMQKSAMLSLEYSERASADVLSPEALAIELRTLKRAAEAIQYRLTGIETQAIEMLKAGDVLPGWGVDNGQGRTNWSRPDDEIFALGDLFGIDLRKAPAPVTPGQAKKAGISADLIAAYSEKSFGATKLVQNDKTIAALVFGRRN